MIIPKELFVEFEKIPRLNRMCIVTEKIDGTNAVVYIRQACKGRIQTHDIYSGQITDDGNHVYHIEEDGKGNIIEQCCDTAESSSKEEWTVHAGSKNRWLSLEEDNYGFARWVEQHADELKDLGPGKHHGEWFGRGIQNRYSKFMIEKKLALFNTSKWSLNPNDGQTKPPSCCTVVPVLYKGIFDTKIANDLLNELREKGSVLVPGARAEGIIIYHVAGNLFFKATCDKDEEWKGMSGR